MLQPRWQAVLSSGWLVGWTRTRLLDWVQQQARHRRGTTPILHVRVSVVAALAAAAAATGSPDSAAQSPALPLLLRPPRRQQQPQLGPAQQQHLMSLSPSVVCWQQTLLLPPQVQLLQPPLLRAPLPCCQGSRQTASCPAAAAAAVGTCGLLCWLPQLLLQQLAQHQQLRKHQICPPVLWPSQV